MLVFCGIYYFMQFELQQKGISITTLIYKKYPDL